VITFFSHCSHHEPERLICHCSILSQGKQLCKLNTGANWSYRTECWTFQLQLLSLVTMRTFNSTSGFNYTIGSNATTPANVTGISSGALAGFNCYLFRPFLITHPSPIDTPWIASPTTSHARMRRGWCLAHTDWHPIRLRQPQMAMVRSILNLEMFAC
jgi:hypothetical protein